MVMSAGSCNLTALVVMALRDRVGRHPGLAQTRSAQVAETRGSSAMNDQTIPDSITPEPTSEMAGDELSELDDIAELDDVEFVLEEVESKIAPLALADL